MAEFDRHLEKKMDERNLQTLNQGFGGLLLFFDCLIKIEKKYLRPVTTTKNSISKGLRTAKSRIQKWRLPIVLVSKYDKTMCASTSAHALSAAMQSTPQVAIQKPFEKL